MAELLPLIRDEGYPLAITNFYGQQGGKFMLEGIVQYPVINHIYGSDALVLHSKDFNSDVNISLQDIWPLVPQDLAQTKRWCLDGNTKVSFTDGTAMKIKDLVVKKIDKRVWGYKDGNIVKAKILDWQIIPEKMEVFEVKTKTSKILITGNNEIFVRPKIGNGSSLNMFEESKWITVDRLKKGDVVYCVRHEPSIKKSSNKEHNSNPYRSSLFSWFNRWRGNNNNNESEKEKSKKGSTTFNSPLFDSIEHRFEDDGLVEQKNWRKYKQSGQTKPIKLLQSTYEKVVSIYKDIVSNTSLGLQLSPDFGTNFALFDNKKRKGDSSDRIYKIQAKSAKTKVQPSLFKTRDRNMGEGAYLESEVVLAVRKVKSPKRRVYDISTETGNFFANEILVHNCPWLPVDHDPIPNAVFEKLKFAYRIIAMSKFGQMQLARRGLTSTYIPHSVNTEIFKPMDKKERKKKAGLPEDSFIVGMVAANKDNPSRKSFQEVIDAFKMFLEKEPKALLYIHTNPEFPGGFPIKEYANFVGIGDKLLFPDTYTMNFNTPKSDMPFVYNAFDMLVAPSISEGFGIPIIEAQSCGTPVVVNNFTAMPELVKKGITGEICELIKGPSGKRFSSLGSYVGIPDTLSLFDCMMKIYNADRVKMGEEARKWIQENFDTKLIFDTKWRSFLEILEKEVYPSK